MADLPAVVDIANACARETDGRDELTLESYTEEWRDPALNLDTNTRVAVLPDGTIAGCVEVWSSAPYVDHWVWGRVHPSLRGQGIGTALMDWAEARVAEYVEQAPPEAQVTLTTASASGHQPTIDLMIEDLLQYAILCRWSGRWLASCLHPHGPLVWRYARLHPSSTWRSIGQSTRSGTTIGAMSKHPRMKAMLYGFIA
jgi:GNAT superfamily N-acetyltransferase